MKIIIIGDESKTQENFTRVMFDIALQRIKKDGGIKFEENKTTRTIL